MNLDQIRQMTRGQLDVDETELPNELLDGYIRDGFNRIIGLETRWPFYESLWDVLAPATGTFPLPTTAREVTSILSPQSRIEWVDSRHAEDWFLGATATNASNPSFWSQVGSTIYLWPRPLTAGVNLSLRGWRKPTDWVGQGAATEVDADDRLHLPIVWYCCALGYAQQEDEVLEQVYMARFNDAVGIAHADVMRPWTGAPKTVNRFSSFGIPKSQFGWNWQNLGP